MGGDGEVSGGVVIWARTFRIAAVARSFSPDYTSLRGVARTPTPTPPRHRSTKTTIRKEGAPARVSLEPTPPPPPPRPTHHFGFPQQAIICITPYPPLSP